MLPLGRSEDALALSVLAGAKAPKAKGGGGGEDARGIKPWDL